MTENTSWTHSHCSGDLYTSMASIQVRTDENMFFAIISESYKWHLRPSDRRETIVPRRLEGRKRHFGEK